MPERDLHELRVKKLLAQDPEINDTQLEEIHMQLNQSIESLEENSKRTRHRVLIALAVFLTGILICQLFIVLWQDAAPSRAAAYERLLIYLPIVITTLVAALTGIWAVALYVFKYAPQLNRARFDLQTSMMLELQQQVKQLYENMERREK
jgi:hypothetical protein